MNGAHRRRGNRPAREAAVVADLEKLRQADPAAHHEMLTLLTCLVVSTRDRRRRRRGGEPRER